MLTLDIKPTFTVDPLEIPTTFGKESIKVTFNYKTQDEWREYVKEHFNSDRLLLDILADDLIVSWERVALPLNKDNLQKLANMHGALLNTLLTAYTDGLNKGKLGN